MAVYVLVGLKQGLCLANFLVCSVQTLPNINDNYLGIIK